MSNPKESPKLLNFFIFHSKYGQREGYEHEKLLYYYPKNENLDTQVRNVGLAEAITRFARLRKTEIGKFKQTILNVRPIIKNTFNKQEDCESLHTQKSHQVYYQAEPNIWMVMFLFSKFLSRVIIILVQFTKRLGTTTNCISFAC
ncbi:Vacuolar fusion protein CCZ1-like protein [Armadillidium vulgare]|nr:Vacuolar fusion protein CCZ1-like protein [Armadillidium vulgare]